MTLGPFCENCAAWSPLDDGLGECRRSTLKPALVEDDSRWRQPHNRPLAPLTSAYDHCIGHLTERS